MSCVFCRIIQRDVPAEVLFENERIISILDINPIHFGHALVLPKRHCQDFLALNDAELADVLKGSQRVAQALVSTLGLEGFNIFSNNGAIAGQSVFHFHMHVTPRYPNDNIRFVLRLQTYTNGAMADYGRRIRDHLPLVAL
jgi:histidine triad (HIT) family protein